MRLSVGWVFAIVLPLSSVAVGQGSQDPYTPSPAQVPATGQTQSPPQPQSQSGDPSSGQVTAPPGDDAPVDVPKPAAPGSASSESDVPVPAAPGSGGQDDGTPSEVDGATARVMDEKLLLDGHVRQGAFLAGPGSLTFVLHHSIMGGVGGLVTMGIASGFRLDAPGAREAMLAGTLLGAGIGFGVSAWWQFNNWLDWPVARFSIVNSLIGGMALTGMFDLFTNDPSTLAWTALAGAELGAWLTVGLGGGEFSYRRGLAIASGAGWATAYAALFLAIIGTSSSFPAVEPMVDTLMIASGVGAVGMALASLKFEPSAAQVMRANLFGAGVGAAVLLVSALVLGGFNTPTPYVLSLLGSAGAITAVSVFWVEAAEQQPKTTPSSSTYRRVLYRAPDKHKPYSNPWW